MCIFPRRLMRLMLCWQSSSIEIQNVKKWRSCSYESHKVSTSLDLVVFKSKWLKEKILLWELAVALSQFSNSSINIQIVNAKRSERLIRYAKDSLIDCKQIELFVICQLIKRRLLLFITLYQQINKIML